MILPLQLGAVIRGPGASSPFSRPNALSVRPVVQTSRYGATIRIRAAKAITMCAATSTQKSATRMVVNASRINVGNRTNPSKGSSHESTASNESRC